MIEKKQKIKHHSAKHQWLLVEKSDDNSTLTIANQDGAVEFVGGGTPTPSYLEQLYYTEINGTTVLAINGNHRADSNEPLYIYGTGMSGGYAPNYTSVFNVSYGYVSSYPSNEPFTLINTPQLTSNTKTYGLVPNYLIGSVSSVAFSSITGSPLDNSSLAPYIEVVSEGNTKALTAVNPLTDYIFQTLKFDADNPINSFTPDSKNRYITYIFGSENHPMTGPGSTYFEVQIALNTDSTYQILVIYKDPSQSTDNEFVLFDSTTGIGNTINFGPFNNGTATSTITYNGYDNGYFFGAEGTSYGTSMNVICDAQYRIEPNVINHLEDALTKIAQNANEITDLQNQISSLDLFNGDYTNLTNQPLTGSAPFGTNTILTTSGNAQIFHINSQNIVPQTNTNGTNGGLYLTDVGTTSVSKMLVATGNNQEMMTECVLNMNTNKITNLATPTSSTDAVNKAYVDNNHINYYSHNLVFTDIGGEVAVRIQNTISSVPTYANIYHFLSGNEFNTKSSVFVASGSLTVSSVQIDIIGIYGYENTIYATDGNIDVGLADVITDKVVLIGGGGN